MLWSYDKKYLAFADIAAQVFIKSYDERSYMLHSYITTPLDFNVDQLLFDRQSKLQIYCDHSRGSTDNVVIRHG